MQNQKAKDQNEIKKKKSLRKSSGVEPQTLFNKLKEHLMRGSKSEIKYNASKNDFGE